MCTGKFSLCNPSINFIQTIVMSKHFPLEFTLEDGVHVTINQAGNKIYDFTLTPKEGEARHFTFTDDKPRQDVINSMDFDQLNAVRRFWLEEENMD